MNVRSQKSIVSKRNFKKLMSTLLPIVKKVVSNQINKLKSCIMHKIRPNKRQNTLKSVSNREIKSLKNNFRVKATKGIINTPKIVTEKPLIVEEPKVVTLSKIATKPKKVIKPKKVNKAEIVIKENPNYGDFRNRVIKQLKKYFKKLHDAKKSKYLDDDDVEYKGITDLELLFEEIDENDYYKPILVKSFHNDGYKEYESRGDKNKSLSIEEYLNKIIPYLKELINNHKAIENGSREWKIQLNANIKNVSLDDAMDIRTFYVWSKNEEIRLGNETDDIVESLINSFLNNYQREQQVWREKSNLVFDCVDSMCYKFHKTSIKRGSSYINSPEWIANKTATINPKNTKCNCCFAYSINVALNHQNIKNHPERIVNIIPFKDQYDWEGIDLPAGIKD